MKRNVKNKNKSKLILGLDKFPWAGSEEATALKQEVGLLNAWDQTHSHCVCRPVVSPVDLVLAVTVDAGVAEALVDLREAGGVVVAVRTQAEEAVDAVHASAAVVAGVDGALVDVDVTHGACAEPAKSHTTGCARHPQQCAFARVKIQAYLQNQGWD